MATTKRMLLSAAALAAIGSVTVLGSTAVNAQESGDTLVERIASKFNVNKDEVQKVFDEVKSEHEAERQADFSERLQDKVDDGKLTAEQKTLIETKFNELQQKRENERDELKQWAEKNNIDLKYLHGGHRHGMDGEDHLQDAVDDGKLTAEQKTLIEKKLNELEDTREQARDELDQWAEDNGIELRGIMPMGGGPRGGGFGLGH